jgi:hypothetical protein
MSQKTVTVLLLCSAVMSGIARGAEGAPKITEVSQAGVGYVNYSFDGSTVNANIGRWDTPYSGQDEIPGVEPDGASILRVDVDVNAGGRAIFNYGLLTYDAGIYDWYDITMVTPQGSVPLVSKLGKPGDSYGSYWLSAPVPLAIDLNPYAGQHIYFIFSVQQDGWGDQTQGSLTGFSVSDPCPIPDLTPFTDPVALMFEAQNGNIFDIADTSSGIRSGYACLADSIRNHKGTVTPSSAYRPPQYQSHLREIWQKLDALRKISSPDCANRMQKISNEAAKHQILGLAISPAGPSGTHTQGLAVDLNWGPNKYVNTLPDGTFIDDLANACGLYRRLVTDPIHFEELQ